MGGGGDAVLLRADTTGRADRAIDCTSMNEDETTGQILKDIAIALGIIFVVIMLWIAC